jgi:hypothetical protein
MARDMEKTFLELKSFFLASCDSAAILLKAHFPVAVGHACGCCFPFSRGNADPCFEKNNFS